jgi:hypothetical protein
MFEKSLAKVSDFGFYVDFLLTHLEITTGVLLISIKGVLFFFICEVEQLIKFLTSISVIIRQSPLERVYCQGDDSLAFKHFKGMTAVHIKKKTNEIHFS